MFSENLSHDSNASNFTIVKKKKKKTSVFITQEELPLPAQQKKQTFF